MSISKYHGIFIKTDITWLAIVFFIEAPTIGNETRPSFVKKGESIMHFENQKITKYQIKH